MHRWVKDNKVLLNTNRNRDKFKKIRWSGDQGDHLPELKAGKSNSSNPIKLITTMMMISRLKDLDFGRKHILVKSKEKTRFKVL